MVEVDINNYRKGYLIRGGINAMTWVCTVLGEQITEKPDQGWEWQGRWGCRAQG